MIEQFEIPDLEKNIFLKIHLPVHKYYNSETNSEQQKPKQQFLFSFHKVKRFNFNKNIISIYPRFIANFKKLLKQ